MSMKKFACLLMLCLPLGCQPAADKGKAPEKAAPATAPSGTGTEAAKPDGNATSSVSDETTTQLVMNVEGMSCPMGCPPAVKTALQSVDGVADVVVDFETKTATVRCDKDKFDQQKAVDALAQAGFQGSLKN